MSWNPINVFILSWNQNPNKLNCFKLLKCPLLIIVSFKICIYDTINSNKNANNTKIENNNNKDNNYKTNKL